MTNQLKAATAWNLPQDGSTGAPALGVGFDPIRMQPTGASPFDVVAQTSVAANYSDIQVSVVSDAQTVTSALQIAVSGSYSGFGNSMSGAASLALNSTVTQKSVSLQLSGVYHTNNQNLDLVNAKLSDTAMALLTSNPAQFLQTYGYGFIGSYVEGGFYSGNGVMTLSDINSSAAVAAKVSGTFSSAGSTGSATAAADYNNIVTQHHCSFNAKNTSVGGPAGAVPSDIGTLFDNFNEFTKGMPAPKGNGTSTAVPVGLVWLTWNNLSCVPNDIDWGTPNYPFSVDPSVLKQLTDIWNQLVYLDNSLKASGPNLVGAFNNEMWKDLTTQLGAMKAKFSSLTLDQLVALPATFFTEITPPVWFAKACRYLFGGMTLQYEYSFDGTISGYQGLPNNSLFQFDGGRMVLAGAGNTHCQMWPEGAGLQLQVQWKGENPWVQSGVLGFNAPAGAHVECLNHYDLNCFRIYSAPYSSAAMRAMFGATA